MGFVDPKPAEPDQALRDNRKKDAKALFFIQSALDDDIFPRIASANTSNQAWEILKQEFFGDRKVITVKLQTLRQEFETLKMKDKESLQAHEYRIGRSQEKSVEKAFQVKADSPVKERSSKVLRSLAHEDRIGRSQEKSVEKAFQVKADSLVKERSNYGGRGRGRGRGGFNGRGCGRSRGHGQFSEQKQFNEHKSFTPRNLIQCKNCKKPGHKENAPVHMLHAHVSLFMDLDTSMKSIVRLGDDKQVQV
ncbi:hypothetical protein Tco_1480431 [Tanacetum coccineum]